MSMTRKVNRERIKVSISRTESSKSRKRSSESRKVLREGAKRVRIESSKLSKYLETIELKGNRHYRCIKCPVLFDRYFNAIRHVERLHERSVVKKCCDITFCTKGDYYEHQQEAHNIIRYAKYQNEDLKRQNYKKLDFKEQKKTSRSSSKSIIAKKPEDCVGIINNSLNINNVEDASHAASSSEPSKQLKTEDNKCVDSLNGASTSCMQNTSGARRKTQKIKKLSPDWSAVTPKKAFTLRFEHGIWYGKKCTSSVNDVLQVYILKPKTTEEINKVLNAIDF